MSCGDRKQKACSKKYKCCGGKKDKDACCGRDGYDDLSRILRRQYAADRGGTCKPTHCGDADDDGKQRSRDAMWTRSALAASRLDKHATSLDARIAAIGDLLQRMARAIGLPNDAVARMADVDDAAARRAVPDAAAVATPDRDATVACIDRIADDACARHVAVGRAAFALERLATMIASAPPYGVLALDDLAEAVKQGDVPSNE